MKLIMLPLKSSRKLKNLLEVVLAVGMVVLLLVSGAWAKKLRPETELYNQARKSYYALMDSKSKRAFSHNWINVIDKFKKIGGNVSPQ